MKKVDLSDLKVGDKVWSCAHGDMKVVRMVNNKVFISTPHADFYSFDGRVYKDDIHPTLFHSEQEFIEYWGFGATLEVVESNQLTKREQFAMAAMQGLVFLGHGINKAAEFSVLHADALLTKLNEKP